MDKAANRNMKYPWSQGTTHILSPSPSFQQRHAAEDGHTACSSSRWAPLLGVAFAGDGTEGTGGTLMRCVFGSVKNAGGDIKINLCTTRGGNTHS